MKKKLSLLIIILFNLITYSQTTNNHIVVSDDIKLIQVSDRTVQLTHHSSVIPL